MIDLFNKGALVLIPNLLGENPRSMFSDHPLIKPVLAGLTGILAESPRGARSLLKRSQHRLPIEVMQKRRTDCSDFGILDLIANGERWGLVSDAGWPAVADPGADLVLRARSRNLNVEICPGPSSILLALALCGLPSQSFLFHGYLPIQLDRMHKKLDEIGRMHSVQSHLCIETPYRNQRLLEVMIGKLPSTWWLSICCALSLENEKVITLPIVQWKKIKQLPQLNKIPTVFVASGRQNAS